MHLIGRWEKVRELGPVGLGLPWMLDRRWARLLPHGDTGEWHRTRDGRWLPIIAGGAFNGLTQATRPYLGYGTRGNFTFITQNLNTAYTYNSAGNANAGRYILQSAKTLNDVYFFINSFTGTAANVNDINVEVRNDANKPGSTLHASGSVNPSSATGWIVCSGFSFAMSAGVPYWIVVADADGGGTDFCQIQTAMTYNGITLAGETQVSGLLNAAGDNAGGFAAGLTMRNALPCQLLHFADGSVLGNPYTADGVVTSDSNQKGLYLGGSGLSNGLKLWGVRGEAINSAWSGLNVWSDGAGPSGSADVANSTTGLIGVDQATSANVAGFLFSSAVTIAAGAGYRFVFTFGTNNGNPHKFSIGTGADANLRKAMLGGGDWVYTTQNAGPGWTDDSSGFPNMALLIEDYVAAVAPSSSGSPLVGPGGLAG